jgi:hypothetical protein
MSETRVETINRLVRSLAERRRAYVEIKGRRMQAEATFRQENSDLFEDEVSHAGLVGQTEQELRDHALAEYRDTKEKAVCPGVSIRLVTTFEYPPGEALDWAKARGICLTLDGKAFKDLCKSDANRPAFVKVEDLPQATIAGDLDAVIARETGGG